MSFVYQECRKNSLELVALYMVAAGTLHAAALTIDWPYCAEATFRIDTIRQAYEHILIYNYRRPHSLGLTFTSSWTHCPRLRTISCFWWSHNLIPVAINRVERTRTNTVRRVVMNVSVCVMFPSRHLDGGWEKTCWWWGQMMSQSLGQNGAGETAHACML